MITVVLVVIAAAVAGWVLAPLHRTASGKGTPDPQWGEDRERTRAVLDAARNSLRDLELDYATGKVSPDDYRALRARFEARATEAARRFDVPPVTAELHAGPPAGGRPA